MEYDLHGAANVTWFPAPLTLTPEGQRLYCADGLLQCFCLQSCDLYLWHWGDTRGRRPLKNSGWHWILWCPCCVCCRNYGGGTWMNLFRLVILFIFCFFFNKDSQTCYKKLILTAFVLNLHLHLEWIMSVSWYMAWKFKLSLFLWHSDDEVATRGRSYVRENFMCYVRICNDYGENYKELE